MKRKRNVSARILNPIRCNGRTLLAIHKGAFMRRFIPRSLLSLLVVPFIAAAAEPAGISEKLRASPDEELAFVLNAQCVQIYGCKPSAKDPYVDAWAFVAPEATL